MQVFLVCGYNDGVYLKYGGKNIKDINSKEFSNSIYNYIIMEVILSVIVLIIGIIFRQLIIVAFSFGLLTYNILGYFKSFYQASGEYKMYGLSLNLEKICIFLGNIILLFIIKTNNEYLYIFLQIIIGFIVVIFLYNYLNKIIEFKNKAKFSFLEIKNNIKSGFVLMIGNFTSSLFTGIDRWFIKILMAPASFAYYAFSVSIENMLNTFISPITISLYNELCINKNDERVRKIKEYILIWITLIISIVFPIKFILNSYLINYKESISIIVLLFSAQIFYAIVNGVYVNLYKAKKEQSYYLKQMLIMIIIAIILNIILYSICRSRNSIAMATLITASLWFIMCEAKNEKLRFSYKSYIFIIVNLFIFVFCGIKLHPITGLIIYLLCYLILVVLLERKILKELIIYLKSIIKKCFKR